MHNIKSIRKNPELFKKKMLERNVSIDLNNLLKLDLENREFIQSIEKLEQQKKIISREKNTKQFDKSKELSTEIDKLSKSQIILKNKIYSIISTLPNLPLDDVPVGKDSSFNKEIKKVGKIPSFDFDPKSHYELGKKNNLMDFDTANKTSGARFVFLKGKLALLERAISNFMIDVHTKEFGYNEISPPLIASDNTMFGTGQLPKFENDQFEIKVDEEKSRKFLIPTAEVILTNMVKESFTPLPSLPIRMVASTPCFRKEAGSYGKDTKGMIRQHQFQKVELVSIIEPKNSNDELNRMLNCSEEILKKLNLPYRVVLLSTGDMGFSAEKTYDIETWIPSEKKYREISSCSSCGQFQAIRMKAKYKTKTGETEHISTLNGSGLAVGRTLIAIMENYQQKDGTIHIPEVLIPYMHNEKSI